MTDVVAYRHAAYDTPWWAFPSSRSGRFHHAAVDVVQYLCLHPLGPAAEVLRHNVGPTGDPDQVQLNLWAVVVNTGKVAELTFTNCRHHGISPEDIVGDDYTATQAFAGRLRRAGAAGLIAPSAALPGTENVVLFGPRLLYPYLGVPFSASECRTGHLIDGARPPSEIASLVRWMGTPHSALQHWKSTGVYEQLDDPFATRW